MVLRASGEWLYEKKFWAWAFLYLFIMLGVLSVLGSTQEGLLALQNLLKLPGSTFQIGSALVTKPGNWILLSAREGPQKNVRILGVFPQWLKGVNKSSPTQRYFSFQVGAEKGKTITFVELGKGDGMNTLLNQPIPSIQGAVAQRPQCYWINSQIMGFRSVECRSSAYSIAYIPEIHISIISVATGGDIDTSFMIKRL